MSEPISPEPISLDLGAPERLNPLLLLSGLGAGLRQLAGGYALLGLTRFHPSIFADIAWSSASVAASTLSRLHAIGWTVHVGTTLRDIDEPADLP